MPDNGHRKYPYLLKGRNISEADEVWCTDITYIPMPQGHAYLCAVMDWHTRYVLGWAVSNTMDAALTNEALEMPSRTARSCRRYSIPIKAASSHRRSGWENWKAWE